MVTDTKLPLFKDHLKTIKDHQNKISKKNCEAGQHATTECSFLLDYFPGDSRKLKKVQELVQYFHEECRHNVPKQNKIYKHR